MRSRHSPIRSALPRGSAAREAVCGEEPRLPSLDGLALNSLAASFKQALDSAGDAFMPADGALETVPETGDDPQEMHLEVSFLRSDAWSQPVSGLAHG